MTEGDLNMSWHENQEAQVVRNPEVRGSNPGSGSNFSLQILQGSDM